MSETLFTARAPEVLAEFEADPSPGATLLALEARVEEDSHLGSEKGDRGKDRKVVRPAGLYPRWVLLEARP